MRFSFLFRSIISISLICILTYFFIDHSSSRLETVYYEIGLKECNKHINLLVSSIIDDNIDEEEFSSSMLITIDESYKEFNTFYLQSIVKNISNDMYEKISINNNYDILTEIPFSLIFDNVLLSSLGPEIPVRFKLLSDAKVNINSKISSFGINNALVELLLKFEFEVLVYIPLITKSENIEISIPIYSSLIEGDVPSIAFGEQLLA